MKALFKQRGSFKCMPCRCLLYFREAHPVIGQLKSHLNEGIWTDSTLLDFSFAKILEGENVEVNVVSKRLGHCQRLGDLLITLQHTLVISAGPSALYLYLLFVTTLNHSWFEFEKKTFVT